MKKTICFLFCLFALFSTSVSATYITEIIPSELKDEFKTYSAQTNEPESMLELFSFNNVLTSSIKINPEVASDSWVHCLILNNFCPTTGRIFQ